MAAADLQRAIERAYPGARSSGPVRTAAVLDIAFDYLLHRMLQDGVFDLCGIGFKGGTAVRKFHLGHTARFSYDLDFNVHPDTAHDAVTLIADCAESIDGDGFSFTVTERRGHHGLLIETPLVPAPLEAKMDFSESAPVLPYQHLVPVETPIHEAYPFGFSAPIPTMHIDENIAEKLSRWQARPLVRDLYDLAHVSRNVQHVNRVVTLYVLKSHLNWSNSAPNRRAKQPARSLAEVTERLSTDDLDLDDLLCPNIEDERVKRSDAERYLRLVAQFARRCDDALTPELRAIANGNSDMEWEVARRLDAIRQKEADQTHGVDATEGAIASAMSHIAEAEAPARRGTGRCPVILPRAKKKCALPFGHKGPHRSVS